MQGPESGNGSNNGNGDRNGHNPANNADHNDRNGHSAPHPLNQPDLDSIRQGAGAATSRSSDAPLDPALVPAELRSTDQQQGEDSQGRRAWRSPSFAQALMPLLGFWLAGALVDRFWLLLDNRMPAWDQADYLNGAINYWALWNQNPSFGGGLERFSPDWWSQFWQLAPKIPPLAYLATLPFFQWLSPSADTALGVQLLFSALLLLSVYGLASCIFPRPVSHRVGLWAAAICLLLPGLAPLRLEYLLDYPLTASVALAWLGLTCWQGSRGWRSWFWAIASGLLLGLAILLKQTALLFLLAPLLWVGITALVRLRGGRLVQWLGAILITALTLRPWVAPNWLMILTSSKRASVDSAIKEGDPSLLSPDAWLYYLKLLPSQIGWPLLITPVLGLLIYLALRRWKTGAQRRQRPAPPSPPAAERPPYAYTAIAPPGKSLDITTQPRPSAVTLVWPVIFILGAYLFGSLNPNKDARYILPYLPAISLLLARGMTFYPPRLRWLPKTAISLSALLLLTQLFPLPLLNQAPAQAALQRFNGAPAYPPAIGLDWPHAELVETMVQTEPYLQNTLGVLPSTPSINQHNVSFFGAQQDFRVFGRQVGVQEKQVEQDVRSLNWFLTKTGDQGSIPSSQPLITQAVESSNDFALKGQWKHPDGGELRLYHRRQPWVTVEPSNQNSPQVQLVQIELPESAPPNEPLPVTYQWVGPLSALQNGLAVLTWEPVADADQAANTGQTARTEQVSEPSTPNSLNKEDVEQATTSASDAADSPRSSLVDSANPPGEPLGNGSLSNDPLGDSLDSSVSQSRTWFHDHSPGLGFLRSTPGQSLDTAVQVTERLAMLPNAAAGRYQLKAVYLDRRTGEQQPLKIPATQIVLAPQSSTPEAPELDWVTQLREWSKLLPQGVDAIGPAFEEVGRVNQYAPRQDYLQQAAIALEHRLDSPPQDAALEKELRYALVLARVLQQDVDGAIAALTPLTQIDGENVYPHAYLCFVNLYGLHPHAARQALAPALEIAPELEIVQILDGVAGLMGGNLIKAFQTARHLLSES